MSAPASAPSVPVAMTLTSLAEALRRAAVPESRLAAEWLVSEVIGCPRLELPLHASRDLAPGDRERLALLGRRMRRGEPLQYVLGHTDFLGLRMRCDRRALIPRPETEGLVERVIASLGDRKGTPIEAADVGTGSGCIAIALAANLTAARVQALDTSRQALDLAAENVAAHRLEARMVLREADLLEGVEPASLDLVVSNPPYVTSEEWTRLPGHIRLHEPAAALEAGVDGLSVVRRLAPQAAKVLRPGGQLWLEIGAAQGRAVAGLLVDAGFAEVGVLPDIAGCDRYVRGETPCSSR